MANYYQNSRRRAGQVVQVVRRAARRAGTRVGSKNMKYMKWGLYALGGLFAYLMYKGILSVDIIKNSFKKGE